MEKYKPEINFNQINSIEGQIAQLRAEYLRAKNDPRHKIRAEELRRKIDKLEKAKYNSLHKK